MSNAKYYTYYKSKPAGCAAALSIHGTTIEVPRMKVVNDALAEFDAIGLSTQSHWGKPPSVVGLVVLPGHKLIDAPYMMATRYHDKDGVHFVVRGKGNRKPGIALNARISAISAELRKMPTFTDWVVEHFGIMHTGLGGPGARGGTSMLSTYGGTCGDVLVFAIPSEDIDRVDIPDELTEITYGQFYDMTEQDT